MVDGVMTDDFRDGITWEKVYSLYVFDRKLRLLVFDTIERVEIAVHSQLVYQLSHKYGSHWQDNPAVFKPAYTLKQRNGQIIIVNPFTTIQKQITSQLHSNKAEVFIKHYRNTYSSPVNPPSWMSIEILYFSQLSIICENLANRSDLSQIAGYFNLPPDVFVSWLHTINYIRNVCAHHARLWNRDFDIEPAILKFSRNRLWLSNPSAYNRRSLPARDTRSVSCPGPRRCHGRKCPRGGSCLPSSARMQSHRPRSFCIWRSSPRSGHA